MHVHGTERAVVVESCRSGKRLRLDRLEDVGRQIALWLEDETPPERAG